MKQDTEARATSASAGFSLIEVLVVLAIMAFVAAIAMPSIGPRREPSLSLAASELAAHVRAVRARAISEGKPLALQLDADKHALQLDDGRTVLALPKSTSLVLRGAAGRDGRSTGIVFFPDGSATGGSLRLSRRGQSEVVAINWATGAVVVGGSQ